MAIGYGSLGSAQSGKTSGTSLSITTTEPVARGATVIVRHGFDNNAAGSLTASAPAPGTLTCSVAGAVTGEAVRAQLNSGSASAAGVGLNVWTFVAGVDIPTGSTITVTVATAVAARAMTAAYIGANFASVTNARGTTGAASVSITPTSATQAALATIVGEDNSGQAFGAVANWDTGTQVGTSGGNAATNVVLISARKMIVGSTAAQTYNPSGTYAGGDWVASAMLFDDTSPAVSSISPNTGLNNAPVNITITGTFFTDVTRVTLGGTDIAYTVNSATQITATVPAAFAAGVHSLVVYARGSYSDGDNYTVTAPTPNAPTSLTATPTPNSVELSWQAPVGGFTPDSYKISRLSSSLLSGDDSNFTSSLGGWTAVQNVIVSHVNQALRMEATQSVMSVDSPAIAVIPGATYTARGMVRNVLGARNAAIGIGWFTAEGVRSFTTSASYSPTTDTYAERTTVSTAPADAVTMKVRVLGANGTQVNGDLHEWDDITVTQDPAPYTVSYPTSTYSDTSVTPGANYTYSVRSSLNGVDSASSNTVDVTVPAPSKPKMSELVDDFSSQDTSKWIFQAATGVNNGSLYIDTTTAYSTVISTNSYDLKESQLAVEIVERPVGTSSEMYFAAEVTSNDRIAFVVVNDGTAVCRLVSGGVQDDTYPQLGSAKFLRFREAAGTLHWETSVDGSTWNTLRSVASPTWANNLKVLFMSGYWDGAQTVTGQARYDKLNLIVPVVSGLFYVDGVAYEAVVDGVVYRAWYEKDGVWVQSG